MTDAAVESLPSTWSVVQLDSVAEVRLGRQRSPQRAVGDHMRPYLRAANVTWSGLDLSDVKEMDFTPLEFEIYKLVSDDVLLNEGQSIELVGRSAIYRGGIDGVCFQKTLLRFRAYQCTEPNFALTLFRSFIHSGHFQRFSRRTTTMAHLSAERFVEMAFPLPPLAEQQRIVAEVERRLSAVEKLEAEVEAGLRRAERLRQAILKRAFAGRLVPQDPNDEPAAALLERIRDERKGAAATTAIPGRRGRRSARDETQPALL